MIRKVLYHTTCALLDGAKRVPLIKFVGKRSQQIAVSKSVNTDLASSPNKVINNPSKFGPMHGRPPLLFDEISCVESGGATKLW